MEGSSSGTEIPLTRGPCSSEPRPVCACERGNSCQTLNNECELRQAIDENRRNGTFLIFLFA